MSKKIPLDLLIILIWSIVTFVFTIIPAFENGIIRIVLGMPMVLFIPGYVLISLLFPKKGYLESIERIALSFGMSIAIVPLLGFLLNFTFGITQVSVLFILYIYSTVIALVAIYRRNKLSEDQMFSIRFDDIYENIRGLRPKSGTDSILAVIFIVTIILAVGIVYFVVASPRTGERFTEFYVLNSSEKADNHQTELKINSSTIFLIGVVDHEYVTVNYTVQVILDKDVLLSEELVLNHGDIWEKNMTLFFDKEGNNMKLEFWLFKENNFTYPYRRLHTWVNITK